MQTKNIYMCITDKGGTGKTLFARLLANRLQSTGKNPLLVDGDGEVGGLYQFYDEALTIRFTGEAKDRDNLLSILDSDKDTILIDMPAASLTSLAIFNDDHDFFKELQKTDYKLTLINVITPFKNSIRTVSQMIELAGNNASYVVATNEFFGDYEDFYIWFGDDQQPVSKARTLLQQVGGKEITLCSIMTGVLSALDFDNINFAAAISEDSGQQLARRSHRTRLNKWLEKMDSEFEKMGV